MRLRCDGRRSVRFDELGVVVASAVMGKADAPEGDTLDEPKAKYDYAFATADAPAWVRTRARETHGDAKTRWLETRSHFDGTGAR